MDAWRVIDCSGMDGELFGSPGTLHVCAKGQPEEDIPLADISVLLLGLRVKLSAGLIVRLMNAEVTVVACDWSGVACGGMLPWSKHTRVGARQRAQADVSLPRRKALWADIVRAKVGGQARVLELHGGNASLSLKRIAGQVRSGDPTNCEAQAARLYWKELFGKDFARTPGAGGEVNWALDYGYTILRGVGVRAVSAAGLVPSLGVFHKGRSNAFNLVDDLMEVYRPAVDLCVADEIRQCGPGDRAAKRALAGLLEIPFESSGATISTSFLRFAQNVGQYFEGSLNKVRVPQWQARLGD